MSRQSVDRHFHSGYDNICNRSRNHALTNRDPFARLPPPSPCRRQHAAARRARAARRAAAARPMASISARRSRSTSTGCATRPSSWLQAATQPPVIRFGRRARAHRLRRLPADPLQSRPRAVGEATTGPIRSSSSISAASSRRRCELHVVKDGQAREILYSPSLFTFGKAEFAAQLPEDIGFAGFA